MEIRTLYTVLAVADQGSFAAAAKALGLSVSSVSLQMRALEEETGLALFDRSRRPPAFTDAGRGFVERARRVIASWEALAEGAPKPGEGGLLRVGCVHTAVSGILPAALLRLRAERPELTITLTTALTHELEAGLRQSRLDVAICTEPERVAADLAFRPFCTQRLVVVAPETAPGEGAAGLLAANPYVRFNRQARVAALVEAALARLGVSPGTAMEIDTLEGVLSLVAHGLGVSVIPEPAGAQPPVPGLRMEPIGDPPATRRLGTLASPAHVRRRFIEALHASLAATCGPISSSADSPSGASARPEPPTPR